jgi:hypothetical protein
MPNPDAIVTVVMIWKSAAQNSEGYDTNEANYHCQGGSTVIRHEHQPGCKIMLGGTAVLVAEFYTAYALFSKQRYDVSI